MTTPILKVTRSFFDQSKVQAEMDAATRRGMITIGSFVRRTAIRSIRRRNNPSLPGNPPHARRASSPLKRLLLFSYEPRTQGVVIGPAAFGDAEAPGTLEFGGTVKPSRRRKGRRPVRPATIKARPFMGPAFDTTLAKIPAVFDGILNRR